MQNKMLKDLFDMSKYLFLINDLKFRSDGETRIARHEWEKKLCEEVTDGLTSDLKQWGLPDSTAADILIHMLALDLIFLSRVKFYFVAKELICRVNEIKPEVVNSNVLQGKKEISYTQIDNGESIHPLFSDYIFKLEKAIHAKLKDLGLLPVQQIERQKMKLVENIKKRIFEFNSNEGSISRDVEITKEKKL